MKFARLLAVCAVPFLLTGCFLTPGKFASAMDIRKDGAFSFSYSGEIYLLALSKLAEMGQRFENIEEEFVEQPCYDEEAFEERACTEEEIAEQRRNWDSAAEARKADAEREAEMVKAMLGGIDPADPDAAADLARRLERQAGWDKVEYAGDGLFNVEFRLAGRMTHDFAFPTMERFPMSNLFVLAVLRDGDTVRVDAPGFAAQTTGNPFQSMMSGMAGMMTAMAQMSEDGEEPPFLPEVSGTFTLTTDGEILANNTDEGPTAVAGGKSLSWAIDKRTDRAPTALVQLVP
ncbi:hypothetical protein [Qipengyuania spongiae]|uniref:Lipoprotein n=1 Tax=Qipengyuania spongiae TaxID=2909673 RepID=A0ABY5SW72_9SPHN|nr:hypothetical protein [Qipengyuania spongiae]UVI38545.1 hypothetical protein L1F33_09790 [Qipengyuania spongiae]